MSSAELWTVGRLLQWTADYLKGHGSESPRLDAEVLLAHVLGRQRIELYTTFDEAPGEEARAAFRELVRRRAEGMPVAYLVGHREFYSLSFHVTPDVLIPRPETELLVVAVLDLIKQSHTSPLPLGNRQGASNASPLPLGEGPGVSNSSPLPLGEGPGARAAEEVTIADVGTGSGAIAVCLAKHLPACRVTAIDVSRAALAVAVQNARQHEVAERIEFVESDLFAAISPQRQFHFIVSNPPYVTTAEMDGLAVDVRKFEPRVALVAGPRGTEVIEALVAQAAERLRPAGHLLMEISPTIHDAVRSLLQADDRFDVGPTIKDLARLPRVVQARRK